MQHRRPAARWHPDLYREQRVVGLGASGENGDLDDAGTTVSGLAERAQMTKHAMAELVRHLERY